MTIDPTRSAGWGAKKLNASILSTDQVQRTNALLRPVPQVEPPRWPGEYVPPAPITREVRLARKLSRKVEADQAMTDRAAEEKAFSDNRERLRSDRLAREAAGLPVQVTKKTKLSK
jgi:hypothetical protein